MFEAKELSAIRKKLSARAKSFDALIKDGVKHPTVRAAAQRASKSLKVCSDLLQEVQSAVIARTEADQKRLEAASKQKSPLGKVSQYNATLMKASLGKAAAELRDSVELIADERDAEAIKALGARALTTMVKIGTTLSGIELVKLVKDLIETGWDLIEVGRSMKFRKNQAKLSSDFLVWLESVSLARLTWAVHAEDLVLRAKGKTPQEDRVIASVIKRIAAA